jgi:FkbM family methyltransferase
MTIIKREDGLYWPEIDIDSCYAWTNVELYTVDSILSSLKNKRTIIHAGGNVGAYTLKFADAFDRVCVFEPDTTNFKCLCLNTADRENVFQFRAALGNRAAQVSITNDTPENCGTFRIKEDGNIPVVTIDSLGLTEVDCIHLDVEGYEMNALLGAENTIRSYRPLIVVEWLDHGKDYGWDKKDITNFLLKLGYDQMKQIGSDMMFKNEN